MFLLLRREHCVLRREHCVLFDAEAHCMLFSHFHFILGSGSYSPASPRRPGLHPSQSVRFVVDKVGLEHAFLWVPRLSPVSIIPPVLHTQIHQHVALTRSTNGKSLGTFQKPTLFRKSRKSEKTRWKSTSNIFCFTPQNISSAVYLYNVRSSLSAKLYHWSIMGPMFSYRERIT